MKVLTKKQIIKKLQYHAKHLADTSDKTLTRTVKTHRRGAVAGINLAISFLTYKPEMSGSDGTM